MKKHINTRQQTTTEIKTIAQICTFLNARGYCVWRHSNTGMFDASAANSDLCKLYIPAKSGQLNFSHFQDGVANILAKGFRKVPCSIKGVPDIIGFNKRTGALVAIEVKLPGDRFSADQTDMLESMRRAGCETYVVKDFPTFSEFFSKKLALGQVA